MAEQEPGLTTEHVKDELDFEMSQEMMAEKGKTAARVKKELDELKLEYKEVQLRYRKSIEKKDNYLGQILEDLDSGCEKQTVECVLVRDYKNFEVRWIHDGKVKKKRPMTKLEKDKADSDLQGNLLAQEEAKEEDLSSATTD